MTFLVRESSSYLVDADTGKEAIEKRRAGHGEVVHGFTFHSAIEAHRQTSVSPIPFEEWPMWAKAAKWISKPEDKGVGDVIARTIGNENSEAFKKWYKETTGKDCGCAGRQVRYNLLYPLPIKT